MKVETHPDAISTSDNTFSYMVKADDKESAVTKAEATHPNCRITYEGLVGESGRLIDY